MKRISTTCQTCGAPLPAHFTNGVKICQYCGASYEDENQVPPKPQTNLYTSPLSSQPLPELLESDYDDEIFEAKPKHSKVHLLVLLISFVGISFLLILLLNKGGNHQNVSDFVQNAVQRPPAMLVSLPATSYTGNTIDFANWEINVAPSVETSNGTIAVSISLKNWNSSSATISYKANNFILYDDVGNRYSISMNGCADDAAFLERQISFDAYESDSLFSSSGWCMDQQALPSFTGVIPGNAKHLYLQLTDFGVFSKITFVYNL